MFHNLLELTIVHPEPGHHSNYMQSFCHQSFQDTIQTISIASVTNLPQDTIQTICKASVTNLLSHWQNLVLSHCLRWSTFPLQNLSCTVLSCESYHTCQWIILCEGDITQFTGSYNFTISVKWNVRKFHIWNNSHTHHPSQLRFHRKLWSQHY
jgi:hypothetical protein